MADAAEPPQSSLPGGDFGRERGGVFGFGLAFFVFRFKVGELLEIGNRLVAAGLTLLLLAVFLGVWHIATLPKIATQKVDDEYAKLVGAAAATGAKSAMPTPADIGATIWKHLADPFYVRGSNDKGIGIQLAYSLARVGLGYLLAVLVAIPVGFLIGMSPLMSRALDPFIQVMKPVSPLAWMPLALYTIKDSSLSAIFVISLIMSS